MDKACSRTRFFALALVIALATLMRLVELPVNFSPIAAMALFAGFQFRNKLFAFAFPLTALFLSDLVLGFHDQMGIVYLAFAMTTLLGLSLRSEKGWSVKLGASLAASVLFFVVTNFAVWAQSGMYERSNEGLVTCFIAALPFLKNSVAGDLLYTVVLFGSWSFAAARIPELRETVKVER